MRQIGFAIGHSGDPSGAELGVAENTRHRAAPALKTKPVWPGARWEHYQTGLVCAAAHGILSRRARCCGAVPRSAAPWHGAMVTVGGTQRRGAWPGARWGALRWRWRPHRPGRSALIRADPARVSARGMTTGGAGGIGSCWGFQGGSAPWPGPGAP